VTAQARITQADMERAVKAASLADRARVIMDLANQRIEIIIGESGTPPTLPDEWTDDDV
jgi:hypothetical protein